jgi:hypothetical protein
VQPTTRRLFSVAVLISMLSVVGFVLAYVFQWPSEFVIGEVSEHNVTLVDMFSGTVSSLPLAPWLALIVFALLCSPSWPAVGVGGAPSRWSCSDFLGYSSSSEGSEKCSRRPRPKFLARYSSQQG